MTATNETSALGRDIAETYWKTTPHVFSHGYPDNTHCALCGITGSSNHIEATPEVQPTVTAITEWASHGGRRFEMELSCKHGTLHLSSHKKDHPKVGSTYSCFECHSLWQEKNYPGLPENIREQIEALIPRCPKCQEPIDKIPFVKHTVHTVYFDLDGQTGQLDGESDHDDTLDEQPEWLKFPAVTDDGWYTGHITVQCKAQHEWTTDRIAYRYRNGDHDWRIVRP